jgi:hypothetical protein
MRSDNIKPRGDVEFVAVGVGLSMTLMCAKCHKKSPQIGSGIRFYMGGRHRVCGKCKDEIDKRKKKGCK